MNCDYEGEYVEDSGEDEDEKDIFYDIYVETSTNLIYEVQFFDTFALVRPASPNLYLAIRKVSIMDFAKEFHEFLGDAQQVRAFLDNSAAQFLIE